MHSFALHNEAPTSHLPPPTPTPITTAQKGDKMTPFSSPPKEVRRFRVTFRRHLTGSRDDRRPRAVKNPSEPRRGPGERFVVRATTCPASAARSWLCCSSPTSADDRSPAPPTRMNRAPPPPPSGRTGCGTSRMKTEAPKCSWWRARGAEDRDFPLSTSDFLRWTSLAGGKIQLRRKWTAETPISTCCAV